MNRSIGLFGTAETPANDHLVTCGRLSLRIRGGELRGGTVHIRFAGEVFEMEDQRNWTDASFKTYLSDSRTARRVKVACSAPLRVAALAYASDGGTIVWLANLSAEHETVAVAGASGACTKPELEHLEDAAAAPDWFETAPETKLEGPLELGAYALARLRLAQ